MRRDLKEFTPVDISVTKIMDLNEDKVLSSVTSTTELLPSIIITAFFIVAIYGGYFLATYFGSKSIIKKN